MCSGWELLRPRRSTLLALTLYSGAWCVLTAVRSQRMLSPRPRSPLRSRSHRPRGRTLPTTAAAGTEWARARTAVAAPATSVFGDGVRQAVVAVQVVVAFGNPIPGQTMRLTSTGSGNVLSAPGLPDANGQYSGSLAS